MEISKVVQFPSLPSKVQLGAIEYGAGITARGPVSLPVKSTRVGRLCRSYPEGCLKRKESLTTLLILPIRSWTRRRSRRGGRLETSIGLRRIEGGPSPGEANRPNHNAGNPTLRR